MPGGRCRRRPFPLMPAQAGILASGCHSETCRVPTFAGTCGGLDHHHERASRRPSGHCRGAAQSHRRRCLRQPGPRPRRARASRPRRRRNRRLFRAIHRRLPAGRSGAQAGVPVRLPRRRRDTGARDRRRRAGRSDRYALGRGRQALQRLCAARRRARRGHPLQGQPAELRRIRRKARVRAGTGAGPGELPRRAARPADLRGYLDRLGRLRERGRMPGRDRGRTPHRAQRLALLARQGRRPPQRFGRARHRGRPAAPLHQPGRRPGRTGL